MAKISKISLEMYIFVVTPLVLMISGFIFKPIIIADTYMSLYNSGGIYYYLFFGFYFFALFAAVLYLYVCFKVIIFLSKIADSIIDKGIKGVVEEGKNTFKKNKPIIINSILLIVMLQFSAIYMLVIVNQIGASDPSRIETVSRMLMEWDYLIFGEYVPFWMQNIAHIDILDMILFKGYEILGVVLALVVIGLIVTNQKRGMRQFLMSFFLVLYIATPIWYAFPALTPYEMYGKNVLEISEGEEYLYAKKQLEKTSPAVNAMQEKITESGSNPDVGNYHVPTFPSMHIAWGLIATFFAFIVWRPFGIITSAWYVINIMGSMYTLQHYAVDVILGVLVAIVAILITHVALKKEKNFSHKRDYYLVIEVIKRDVSKLKKKLKGVIKFLRNMNRH